MNTPVLRIEKRINAEPARLFRAWLEPKDFSRWFFSGLELGKVTLDPRPGGKFRIEMISGGTILPHEGQYQTIDEPSKIVFTWNSHATGGKDTLVTITFSPTSDSPEGKPATLITLVHERLADTTSVEKHTGGWSRILDGLEQWMG
ncbi:MAG: SRPBCC domain-containing protein [Leptospirales bacterium]|nr:SRPBCC domain-containing protein [Leptospirales bacterium]